MVHELLGIRRLQNERNIHEYRYSPSEGRKGTAMNGLKYVMLGVVVSSFWLMACAHAPPPPAGTPPILPIERAPISGSDVGVTAAQTATTSSIHPSDEVMRRCELHFESEAEAPKFDFDSAGLQDGDRSVLDQVVSCLTTGPLAGRSVQLIGRADPRGPEDYNFVLGGKRAGAVGDYLEANGVGAAHVAEASRGKLDSKGTDEAGWQLDRRVDIELVP